MSAIFELEIELEIKLEPQSVEGGYTRYVSADLPGFRVLCEPKENPLPLIEAAARAFIPAAIKAHMDKKLVLKGLRFHSSGAAFFHGAPSPIQMAAEFANA